MYLVYMTWMHSKTPKQSGIIFSVRFSFNEPLLHYFEQRLQRTAFLHSIFCVCLLLCDVCVCVCVCVCVGRGGGINACALIQH